MADIPLRTYVQQLDNLIERHQVDEATAHCRHILGLYPKHLETYRMLGKALLEKGRHGDAADIFQRVLSVMPDDFISHVGMSIVREDEANLDSAIWHMERAFESAPANGAIQQELCRLYGRRDGVVPAKARLTRGALARMYAQGGLYLQAEAELKAALAAEADRVDLLTKLADVYWQTDQPAQAAQTSAAILQKLPYSLEANRILDNVFRAQGRVNEAAVYRQRLEALDPYEAFADPAANGSGTARVDPAKVTVARLDYAPGMEDSGSPDWLASIGAKFEEPTSPRAPEAQPDWLSGAGDTAPSLPAADYQPGQSGTPDWLKDLDSGPAGVPDAQTSATPDWLKDIGNAPVTQAQTSGTSDEELPDWLVSNTGPLPADSVPTWMLQGSAEAESNTEDHATGPLTAPGLLDAPTVSRQTQTSNAMPATPSSAPILVPMEPTGDVPDWLKTTVPDEGDEELPDWLKAITTEPLPAAPTQPTAGASTALPMGEAPNWSPPTAPEGATTAPTPPAAQDLVPAESTPAANTEQMPDWLQAATADMDQAKAAHQLLAEPAATEPVAPVAAIAPEAAPPQYPAPPEGPAAAEMAQPIEAIEPTSLGTLPDWLKDLGTPAEAMVGATSLAPVEAAAATTPSAPADYAAAEPPVTSEIEPGRDLPDWLKQVAPTEANLMPPAASPDSAGPAPALGGAELPDWLQTAAAVPAQNETPVWLQTAPAGPGIVESQAEPEPPLEIPDWLKEVAATAPPADVGQSAPVELPDYLQMASPEAIARAEQPLELEPEETEPEEDEPALALPAEIPDWLKALAPVTPDPILPAALTPAPVAAEAGLQDQLSWMDELTSPAASTGAAAASEPAPDELPAWLAAPAAQAPTEVAALETGLGVVGGLGEDTLAGEIPPWAQNDEPGPSDTIVSWLAGKHVPDWLRQPANEAPGLPAVEWEPNQAELADQTAPVDSLASTAAATEAALSAESPAPPEQSQAAAPDLATLDPEDAFRWLESLAAQQGANPEELFTAPAVPTLPTVGAAPAEPVQLAAERPTPASEPAPLAVEQLALAAEPPAATPVEPAAAASEVVAAEPGGLEAFLRQTEAAMPADHIIDTAPNKPKAPTQGTSAPAIETAPAGGPEPALASAETTATVSEPALADLDGEAALRWLEGLAAQQGAKPEELLTAPEDRTLEAPEWVAAEQAAAAQEPAPATVYTEVSVDAVTPANVPVAEPAAAIAEVAPAAIVPEAAVVEIAPGSPPTSATAVAEVVAPEKAPEIEPAAEPVGTTSPVAEMAAAENLAAPALAADADTEAALRWLEGLAAQQGAKPEELLTLPEDRTLEAPTWVATEAQAAADLVTPQPEASPFEAVTPTISPLAEAEPEPAEPEPEPEPAVTTETPEWLRALAPAEAQLDTTPATPTEPEPAAPAQAPVPLAAGAEADLDKLSRLAERLAAARRAREAEMEARFAEQRNQQEAARRWVEERMETKRAEPEAPAAVTPAAEAATAPTVAEVPAAALVPAPMAEAPAILAAVTPAETGRPHPRPAIRVRRPQPAPLVTPPVNRPTAEPAVTPAASVEALARGQAALAGQDYETAVAHLSVLVEHGHHLDTVVQSLESAAQAGPASAPVLRLLGDAYVRTDQLQKALDTYRQALRRL